MITISPLYYHNHGNHRGRTLGAVFAFTYPFDLPLPGRWAGSVVPLIGLRQPVTRGDFDELMQRRSPRDYGEITTVSFDPQAPAAWRVAFRIPAELSRRWIALPVRERDAVQHVVRAAVRRTMLKGLLQERDQEFLPTGCQPRRRLLAMFEPPHVATTLDPQLQGLAVLFNWSLDSRYHLHGLSAVQIMHGEGPMRDDFLRRLSRDLTRVAKQFRSPAAKAAHLDRYAEALEGTRLAEAERRMAWRARLLAPIAESALAQPISSSRDLEPFAAWRRQAQELKKQARLTQSCFTNGKAGQVLRDLQSRLQDGWLSARGTTQPRRDSSQGLLDRATHPPEAIGRYITPIQRHRQRR